MKYQEALGAAIRSLAEAGVAEPQADAWALFEYSTGINRTHFFLSQRDEMGEEERSHYERLITERAKRIPLQQLTGRQYFCGYEFLVNRHVLIPRQDTEVLVEEALKKVNDQDMVLDLCTGSGCILLSIAKLSGKGLTLIGSDLSEEALKVAQENAKRLDVDAKFTQGDLFAPLSGYEGKIDMIVSNPPYIATKEIEDLEPEVRDHEPYSALDGKEDGLYFYDRIIKEAGRYLRSGGWLLFEIGYDQGVSVPALMDAEGYTDIYVKKDLAGLDRVVAGRKN